MTSMQPTPEEWWATLTADDRALFIRDARQHKLSEEGAAKMRKANILVAYAGFGTLEPMFPNEYREHVLEQAGSDPDGE